MNIVKPYAKMVPDMNINMGILMLKCIEKIARVSHRSEDAVTENSWERFIPAVVIQKGDWSVVEHANVTVEAVVDRGISHEWVRHRIGSYTQESTRFVNYEKKMPPSFIYPRPQDLKPCFLCDNEYNKMHLDTTGRFVHFLRNGIQLCSKDYDIMWYDSIKSAEQHYKALLTRGWTPQEARSVFPNALATKLIVTYNLRMWRHFFLMRTTKEAHPQMKEVTIPLLKQFKDAIPFIYDDIKPDERQSSNLALPDGDNAKDLFT